MTEIDVALTDFLLFLESGWFATFIGLDAVRSALVRNLRITFAGFSLASLLGTASHGFFNSPDDPFHVPLWRLTLVIVGVTAAGFALTGLTLFGERFLRYGQWIVLVILMSYVVATAVRPEFIVAILFYVPATLICLAGLAIARGRCPGRGLGIGVLGLVVSLVAPVVQQLQLSVHPVYLTYNSVYHVILMFALYLFYLGAKGAVLCAEEPRA